MAGHTSEKRWRRNQTNDSGEGISNLLQSASENVITALTNAETLYKELLELYQYCGGTAQGLADQLFYEDWSVRESDPIGNPGVFDTQANALEVEKAQAAIDAATAMHELYQAADNQVVTQADRFAEMRRMS
jgi:hypothetical protein